ncbi:tRNA uridine(34) 5-carboxymethylaminomethyl modification radical SAM/GNAT enzyme Elp3, partial [Candidatus Woesearchaeota archaeon]|nr:tRNA uridine(34) 5-carboxymethylaminomethyl modification radical SAM/GNAT enzyme Elp3 [Candidatus Woesearchaeota archaeon]
RIPTDIEVLLHAGKEELESIKPYLQTKPARTGSGVAVIATMTAPFPCPHGSCTYCPGGPGSTFGDTPKSYTGKEPSTMRGQRHDYDPYRIIFNRLEQYIIMGQNPDKVEQIIMGGTFPSFPKAYQEEFIMYSFKAYNDFSRLFFPGGAFDLDAFKAFFVLPGTVGDPRRAKKIKEKALRLKQENVRSLAEEQRTNETATIRCVGLTIETRPDWGRKEHGLEMLRYGATRVELGVQTTDDDVLRAVHRDHTTADTKKSIAELRDLGFKLNFHIMPGLAGKDGRRITKEQDLTALKEIFTSPDYKPDMLKLYPCMVMPDTTLEQDYKKGIFKPLSAKEAADIIVDMKRFVPEWCRIMRIQRDIPTNVITAGVERTNLRQQIQELAQQRNVRCRCIRCREIRKTAITEQPTTEMREYEASKGKEYFISMEADDKLLGFLRLRFPQRSLHPVITNDAALIRELHVYGQAVMIGADGTKAVQHRGVGKQLVGRAEALAQQHGKRKMVVISGVGVRDYYRKLGYEREGPYMTRQW